MNNLKTAALSYAKRQWQVIPLYNPVDGNSCSCGNPECHSVGKHPRIKDWANSDSDIACARALYEGFSQPMPRGKQNARQIREWWERWPNANIGIVTGAASGIVVLDIDEDEGLDRLEDLHGPIPETLMAFSGRGSHYYFAYPGRHIQNRVGIVPGVDIRGDGGYIVAPPSLHKNGEYYEWCDFTTPLAPIPEWLIQSIERPPQRREKQRLRITLEISLPEGAYAESSYR